MESMEKVEERVMLIQPSLMKQYHIYFGHLYHQHQEHFKKSL